jgi:hypothetical protein
MPSNTGSQKVTLLFFTPANSPEWNLRFAEIRKTGVYSGGWLSIINNTTAQISPLVCEISDGTYQVKVKTAAAVNITVNSTIPYIILRWVYTGSATNDFMSLLAVATPLVNDLVVGKCTFDGSLHLNGFTYGDTTYQRSNPAIQDLFLKVEETGDLDMRVRVRGGRIQTSSGIIFIEDQKDFYLFTPPASPNSKVYLVYIDTITGNIGVDASGTAALNPLAPDYAGKLVIAEVTLAYTDTISIPQSKIKDVRSFITANLKEYIDDAIAAIPLPVLGTRTNKDTLNNAIVTGSIYKAECDGIISGYNTAAVGAQFTVTGRIGTSNPPVNVIEKFQTGAIYATAEVYTFRFEVAKDEYFKIEISGNTMEQIYWRPYGSGGCIKQ